MSALLSWSDELSVGIQEIDEQHKVLVALLNDLHNAVLSRHGREAVGPILGRLAEYTRIHFAVEESLMRILDYPRYEEHKEEHVSLIKEVNELHRKFNDEGLNISMNLLHFLKDWLGEHIIHSDRDYGPFFLSRGAKTSWKSKSWLKRLFH
ncbi:MAG: bacteriohemerythrin [Gammaproteobacteria bacterium]|nr:bacteriohemerythrin [Gammaproteobacteria bacterium]